jgi:hypothetical protein
LRRPPPQNIARRIHPEISATTPTSVAVSVPTSMSLFLMWESSCASTPSSSTRLVISNSPVVTATDEFSGLRPVANALGAGSSIT